MAEVIKIKIIKTKAYTKDYRAKLKNKHMNKEMILLEKIEQFLISSESMKEVMQDSLHIIYNIEKKKRGSKRVLYSKVESKIKISDETSKYEYPYELEEVYELEFISIDDKHYGDG